MMCHLCHFSPFEEWNYSVISWVHPMYLKTCWVVWHFSLVGWVVHQPPGKHLIMSWVAWHSAVDISTPPVCVSPHREQSLMGTAARTPHHLVVLQCLFALSASADFCTWHLWGLNSLNLCHLEMCFKFCSSIEIRDVTWLLHRRSVPESDFITLC